MFWVMSMILLPALGALSRLYVLYLFLVFVHIFLLCLVVRSITLDLFNAAMEGKMYR